LLKSKDAPGRAGAASILSGMRPVPDSAIPAFIEALRDETQGVRFSAATALGRCEGPEGRSAVPALYDSLRDQDEGVRSCALQALVHHHEDASRLIPAAIQSLRSKNSFYRVRAAEILGSFGPAAEDALPALQELRDDENRGVRTEVEKALKAVSPTEAAMSLQRKTTGSEKTKAVD